MYFSWGANVLGSAAIASGSCRTEFRDGVSRAFALPAASWVCLEVMNWMSCQAAPLCSEALFIQMPNGWTSSQWSGLTAGHGMAQNAVSVATLDWVASSTEGMVPEPSCHMATRPCWKSDRQLVTR